MRKFLAWYHESTSHIFMTWASVLLLVWFIAALNAEPPTAQTSSNSTETTAKQEQKEVVAETQYDAYGICCQLARDKYGKADHSFIEGTDMGDGDWIIRGSSDIRGKRFLWTAEVQHNPSDDTWTLKGWAERNL